MPKDSIFAIPAHAFSKAYILDIALFFLLKCQLNSLYYDDIVPFCETDHGPEAELWRCGDNRRCRISHYRIDCDLLAPKKRG